MDLNAQKQEFSIAYMHALAAAAGVKLDRHTVDDDSIDIQLSRGGHRSPKLEVQLKCSAEIELRDDDFSFRIKLKNYEDLRRETMVPRILVVLHVPDSPEDWLVDNPDHLLLRHRAYWISLLGQAEIKPESTRDWQEKKITVRLLRANLVSPAVLRSMMDNIERTDAI